MLGYNFPLGELLIKELMFSIWKMKAVSGYKKEKYSLS